MKGDAKKDPMWAFFERCAAEYDSEKVAQGLRHFMEEAEKAEQAMAAAEIGKESTSP